VIKRYTNPQLLYFTPSAPLLTQMSAMISGGGITYGENILQSGREARRWRPSGRHTLCRPRRRRRYKMPRIRTPDRRGGRHSQCPTDCGCLGPHTRHDRPALMNSDRTTHSLSQSTSRAGQNALSTRISAKQITAQNPCISCPVFAAERDKAIWICAFCIVSRSRSTMTVFAALVRFYRATLSASAVFAMGLCVFLSATSQSSTKTAKRTFVVSTDMARRAVPRR